MATIAEIIRDVKIIYDKLDTDDLPGLPPEEIKVILDFAQDRLIDHYYRKFDSTREFTDRLRLLTLTPIPAPLVLEGNIPNVYTFDLSTLVPVYRHLLKVEVETNYVDCNGENQTKYVRPNEEQQDDIYALLEDPFNRPRFDRPLSITENNKLLFYASANFTLSNIRLTYLRQPKSFLTDYVDADIYDNLPPDMEKELVLKAVQITTESIQDQISYPTVINEQVNAEKQDF